MWKERGSHFVELCFVVHGFCDDLIGEVHDEALDEELGERVVHSSAIQQQNFDFRRRTRFNEPLQSNKHPNLQLPSLLAKASL